MNFIYLNLFILLLSTFCFCHAQTTQYELLDYNPVASASAMVVVGNARFTVLTPELLRIEFSNTTANPGSPSSPFVFEDRATIAVVNRLLPVPAFTTSYAQNPPFTFTLQTAALRLTFIPNTTSLQVVRLDNSSAPFQGEGRPEKQFSSTFTLGVDNNNNAENLLGTICSLDELNVVSLNCTLNAAIQVHGQSLHCAWGVAGRKGFALLDDTGNWAMLPNASWWAPTSNVDALDIYLFFHGANYKRALRDFVQISGRPAMTPRSAMGIWGTRWFNYATTDLKRVIGEYVSRQIPFDVQVIDMNWHTKQQWTGWTPDATLYPVPSDFFSWLSAQGVASLVNVHDAEGVAFYEQMFPQFAAALGLSPDPQETPSVPFSAVNSSYLYTLDDVVLANLHSIGIGYAWIDWQQGVADTTGGGQNPTIILAKVRATDFLRWGNPARGMVLSRFGGIGAQRYPVGFSGDVASLTWANLAFQPYFSWTAANVAFTWSHDLVGPHDDHEMHTRWLQWGAFSGIFRTHDRGMSSGSCNNNVTISTQGDCAIVEPWMVPEIYFLANRACIRDRAALLPYLYNAAAEFYSEGLSPLRPMYYEFPHHDSAYLGDSTGAYAQYFFGSSDMIVAPVVFPSDHTQMALVSTWIPPGKWYERDTALLHDVADPQGYLLTKYYDLSEIPVFIRAGAIVPTIPLPVRRQLGLAASAYYALIFTVYPGLEENAYAVYEDDGNSTAYLKGAFGKTHFKYTRSPTRFSATITAPPENSYDGQPGSRRWSVVLVNAFPPASVQIKNINLGTVQTASYSRFLYINEEDQNMNHNNNNNNNDDTPIWNYDGESFSLIIRLPRLSVPNTDVQIDIAWASPFDDTQLSGYKGIFRHAMLAKAALDLPSVTEGSHSIMGGYLNLAASLPDALGYFAGNNISEFSRVIKGYRSDIFESARQEVQGMFPYTQGAYLQLYSQGRFDSCLCGNAQCVEDNDDYQQVLVEGFSVSPSAPGAIPLYWYWSDSAYDNYMTTDGSLSLQGYEQVGVNGYLFSDASFASGAKTLAVSIYYHPVYLDHMTVATTAGTQWAVARGYQLLQENIGWALAENPNPPESRDDVPHQTLVYAQTLLNNIYIE